MNKELKFFLNLIRGRAKIYSKNRPRNTVLFNKNERVIFPDSYFLRMGIFPLARSKKEQPVTWSRSLIFKNKERTKRPLRNINHLFYCHRSRFQPARERP